MVESRPREHRREVPPVVQQAVGIVREALLEALVRAHCLGAEEWGLDKQAKPQG